MWTTEKKMNTRNYTFHHVNKALKIKNNSKEEKIWLKKEFKIVTIFLIKWLYFGHHYISFHKTTIYLEKRPYYFKHFCNFFLPDLFLFGNFLICNTLFTWWNLQFLVFICFSVDHIQTRCGMCSFA